MRIKIYQINPDGDKNKVKFHNLKNTDGFREQRILTLRL